MRSYLVVTAGYWAFTLTDGAIRMLVVLYFYGLGYSPLEVAALFLFYEFFGIVTNLVGGWLGARVGLNLTMQAGMALQVVALAMLTVPDEVLSVLYVMGAQALSGIAKDLNKMSAKASVKVFAGDGSNSRLYAWVTALTGSKNALKGAGFFLGGALLATLGFRGAVAALAVMLAVVLIATALTLPRGVGRIAGKPKFTEVFSVVPAINRLAAARFFLFASRDVWFVVGLPIYLSAVLGWTHPQVGTFLALWIIGYGAIQALTPQFIQRGSAPQGGTALLWISVLTLVPLTIALLLNSTGSAPLVLMVGLGVFALVFAINSAVHSYLVLAYSQGDEVAMNVGFYYMANAGGRLLGTIVSGASYQTWGLEGCLWVSVGLLVIGSALSTRLPSTS